MKLEKLLTLSQFIDDRNNQLNESDRALFSQVITYNDFLKQPLTKDMFINDLSDPTALFQSEDAGIGAMEIYREAEKKVMFKGNWRYQEDDRYNFVKWVSLGLEKVMLNKYNTLSELAEATQGNLELNNIEI